MSLGKIVAVVSILLILFVIAYSLVVFNISGPPASTELRRLGSSYLYYMYNSNYSEYYTGSPEGVSAILWDYRGIDTLYETIVLFTAVIGAVMIYREYMENHGERRGGYEFYTLSVIVRAVSKIILWLTILLSIAIGLTGQLTPGGGFIGGAAFAVVPILVVLVYNPSLLEKLGFTRSKALLMRTTGLLLLFIVILLPYLAGGYVFQNQYKPNSTISYPDKFIDETPLGGSIFWLNSFELLAVAGAFTLSFLILSYIIALDYFRVSNDED